MLRWKLFYRLMMRPLFREPVRLGLMVLAVGLGVAVVLAIELAGNAAAGSFHSSMESLAGDNDLEVVASGGWRKRWWRRWPASLIHCGFPRGWKISP